MLLPRPLHAPLALTVEWVIGPGLVHVKRDAHHVQEAWTIVDSESQRPYDDREPRVD